MLIGLIHVRVGQDSYRWEQTREICYSLTLLDQSLIVSLVWDVTSRGCTLITPSKIERGGWLTNLLIVIYMKK